MTISTKQTSVDSWEGLLNNFLKASDLKENTGIFVCVGVDVNENDMELQLENESGKYIFSMNVTNKVFLKNNGIKSPKEVIGKKLTFKKVLVTNPQTKKEVESLRISKVD